jgi:diacylglycerol kinase (ATP)
MDTLAILNPIAAGGIALKEKDLIDLELKEEIGPYELYISKSSRDIVDTAKRYADKGFKNFIGIGGDGTLHYIANAIAGTDCNLGIIPMGSGNDISRNLDISHDIKESIRVISKKKVKRLDLGLINDKYYYICIAGSGFNSEVNKLANETRLPIKGSSKYKYAVYKTLMTYKAKNFHMIFNDLNIDMKVMMMVVSNMPVYGGGMNISPDASPYDDLFDICIIKEMTKMHFIKSFPGVFKGTHINDPFVDTFKTKKIEISSDYDFSVYADGDYICNLPAKFETVPKALNIFVP